MVKIETIYDSPLAKDPFWAWYRNGCTSGLNSLEAAKQNFDALKPEEQQNLRSEFTGMLQRLKGTSGWSGPFAG